MSTTPTQAELAEFGAQVYARMTFSSSWDSSTFAAIEDDATAAGLTAGDNAEAREVCKQYELEPSDYGDTLPSITDTAGTLTATEMLRIRTKFAELHDARTQGDSADEAEHAAALIEMLATRAGLCIK